MTKIIQNLTSTTSGYTPDHDPNNADATPVYSGIFGGGWSINDWETWFYSMQTAYGTQTAHDRWIAGWNAQSFWSFDYSWDKYDSGFNQFVKDNHLDASNWIADVVTKVEDKTVSIINSAGNAIEDVFSGVGSTAKLLPYIVAALAIGVVTTIIIASNKGNVKVGV